MASSKEYVNFILEQLSGLEGVRCRAMMGEYVLYYKDKIAGTGRLGLHAPSRVGAALSGREGNAAGGQC